MWDTVSALAAVASVMVNTVLVLVTLRYVMLTGQLVEGTISGQRRAEEFQNQKIRNDTLIDLTRMWGSKDFISARNRTDILLQKERISSDNAFRDLLKLADIGKDHADAWVNLSLIAHFLARVGQLLHDDQIEFTRTKSEFRESIKHWAPILVPIYATFPDETRITGLLTELFSRLNPDIELGPYPYGKEGSAQKAA